jgi:hypothetical protein
VRTRTAYTVAIVDADRPPANQTEAS